MKILKTMCTLIVLIGLLSSCADYKYVRSPDVLNYTLAYEINKGDNLEKVKDYLDRAPLLERDFTIKNNSNKFHFLVFERDIFESNYDFFTLLFKNDKLLFWNNLDELKLCDDAEINQAGIQISDSLFNNKSERK